MGAWGYGHFDNDTAQDWLAFPVRATVDMIAMGLRSSERDEVIAAAGLLDALTPYKVIDRRPRPDKIKKRGKVTLLTHGSKTKWGESPLGLHYEAEQQRLYSEAAECIDRILSPAEELAIHEKTFIDSWKVPAKKRAALEALSLSLAAKERAQAIPKLRRKA